MTVATNSPAVAVCDVFVDNYYGRGRNEDGAFEYLAGYVVFAKRITFDGLVEVYGFSGCVGNNDLSYLHVFDDKAEAEAFVGRVKDRGFIKAAAYWWLADITDPNELPDYVTNPGRPEYN